MNEQRYFIGSDNSGHEYLVPVKRSEDFEQWSTMDEDDPNSWEAPDYAVRCEGGLTFSSPRFDR